MSAPLKELLSLLRRARREHIGRPQRVAEFQALVWDGIELDDAVSEVLRELAYDLDFFEADPGIRNEDPSYFGNERLEREIDQAFEKLKQLGVQVDADNADQTA